MVTVKNIEMKKYVFVMLVAGGSLLGCKKNKDNNTSNTSLLTNAVWKYDTAMIDYDKNGTPDFPIPPGTIAACSLDNTVTFKSDSTGIMDEGPTKCSLTNPQSTSFTWYFKENETVLYSPDPIFGGLSGDVKIAVLNSSKLEVIKEYPVSGTTSVNIILDLKH